MRPWGPGTPPPLPRSDHTAGTSGTVMAYRRHVDAAMEVLLAAAG